MTNRVSTFSHPDLAPQHCAHSAVDSPLERLSQGDLSAWHSRPLAHDPRLMPPPRKAVVRNSILMGRPAAVNAATSAMLRARSNHYLQRVPCPPTPPDSPADDSSPLPRRNTLSWHPLPVFVGIDRKDTPATPPCPDLLPRDASNSPLYLLVMQLLYWHNPTHSLLALIACLTALATIQNPSCIVSNCLCMTGLSLVSAIACQSVAGCYLLTADLFRWPMLRRLTWNKLYPLLISYDPHLVLTCITLLEGVGQMSFLNACMFICLAVFLGPKMVHTK